MEFWILILDDEKMVCNSLRRVLEGKEKNIVTATTVEEAWKIIKSQTIDLVLLDYRLNEGSGLHFLEELKEQFPEIQVIMITAFGNIEVAVKAMKLGAFDFIQKNAEPDFIRFTVKRALDNLRLRKEVEELRVACQHNSHVPRIISFSPVMQQALDMAREFAKTDTTVLIQGETGTGKNLIGQYIHLNSPRFNQPFITINCAAIPHELMESELFGYEKGAFTGASQKGKKGLIEQANGGTLFLDEISELTTDLQSKLLHVLETNQYYRIGAEQPTSVDVRFLAATNTNLEKKVEQNQFRIDLFYRLNVATITIPPLRDRREDILPLAKHFIEEFNRRYKKDVAHISPEVFQFLENSTWKGNVRELRNVIERAILLKKGNTLELKDFTGIQSITSGLENLTTKGSNFHIRLDPEENTNLLHQAQKQLIERALMLSNHNRTRAAKLLGIPRTSLNFYIQKFGIGNGSQNQS